MPPGAQGTITRTGLSGQTSWAETPVGSHAAQAAATKTILRTEVFMIQVLGKLSQLLGNLISFVVTRV